MRKLTLALILTMVLATSAMAFAPDTVTFQGRLSENGGAALADGNYSVTFRIYTQLLGGAPIWTSTRQVSVAKGVFSLVLGENNPLTLPFDQPYFVGVQYEAELEMAPRVALTSTPYALGVSEAAAVTSLNGLTGDMNLVAGSNVNIGVVGNDLHISSNGAVSDNDWNVVGNDMHSAPIGNVGLGTPLPQSKLQVVGDITTGDAFTVGSVFAYNTGGYTSQFGGDHAGLGSKIALTQTNGDPYLIIEPDYDGNGGFVHVGNGNGSPAIQIDGDYSGGDPRISFYGSSSVFFNLYNSGDDAVVLPGSSINAAETLDEAGLASINDHGTSSFAVGTSYGPVTSRTIIVPADGYILASSSLEIELNHQGTSCYVTAGLSTVSTTVPNNQDLSFYLPSTAATGQYLLPSSPTAVFPVSAGSHTIYIVARRVGTTDAVIWDAQLNLLFVPTSYGTVAVASAQDDGRQEDNDRVSSPLTSADISDERRQSVASNDQRLADELAALRAQVDALQATVDGRPVNGVDQVDR